MEDFQYSVENDRLLQTQEEIQIKQQQQKQQQQQQQQNWNVQNQQQQFEQNVQDLFGIGANNEMVGNFNYDPFSEANTKDVNTSAFMTALCLNAMLFVVLIGGYEVVRRFFPSVYSPKSRTTKDGSSSSSSLSSHGLANTKSSAAVSINTQKPLGWVTGVARASWSTVRSSGGLDSYMFLRYVRLCFRISFTSALWGMIILWPGECIL